MSKQTWMAMLTVIVVTIGMLSLVLFKLNII